jgi:hypothetical protein
MWIRPVSLAGVPFGMPAIQSVKPGMAATIDITTAATLSATVHAVLAPHPPECCVALRTIPTTSDPKPQDGHHTI